MSPVDQLAENVAERHARAQYDLSQEEGETLTDAEGFVRAAFLREVLLQGIPEPHVDPDNPRGVEDLTPTEVAMIREGTAAVGRLTREADDRAAEALGEYPEPLSFADRLTRDTTTDVEGGETA